MAGELVANPAANGQICGIRTRFVNFLAILFLVFALSFFSETRDSDLSSGLGFVESYTLWKKLLVVQGQPLSTEISENLKIWNSDQIWGSNGRIFHQFPVLTHNFHHE